LISELRAARVLYRFPSEIGAGAWTTADPFTTPMSLRAIASVGMTLSYG
jgi:hypothetical protein